MAGKTRDKNRARRIWDVMDDNGATIQDLGLHFHMNNAAIGTTMRRMVLDGYLRKTGNTTNVRYFKNIESDPPEIVGDNYSPGVVDLTETVATNDLLDTLETHILEMDTAAQAAMELITKLKPLLISNELIEELRELRAIKKQVQNALGK